MNSPLHIDYEANGRDVHEFHVKFGVPMPTSPHLLNMQAFEFRTKFLAEELKEFKDAHNAGDLQDAADSLVDLVYVALGTALMMGIPWQQVWNEVQRANMAKERAKADGSNSKRGSALDVIKPAGWTPPDHSPALGTGPWPVFFPPEA